MAVIKDLIVYNSSYSFTESAYEVGPGWTCWSCKTENNTHFKGTNDTDVIELWNISQCYTYEYI